MSGVVAFDYSGWAARYPELAICASAAAAQAYFSEATLYLDNTECSPIQDVGQRAALLGMLTAHIAALNAAGSSPLVGRINTASEGSVSVAAEYAVPGTAAWFVTTKYGAAFWQAMVAFRRFKYVLPAGRSR